MKKLLSIIMIVLVGFVLSSFSSKPVYEKKSSKDSINVIIDIYGNSLNKSFNKLYTGLVENVQKNNTEQVQSILTTLKEIQQVKPTVFSMACKDMRITEERGLQIIKSQANKRKLGDLFAVLILVASIVYVSLQYTRRVDFRQLISSLIYLAIAAVFFSYLMPNVLTNSDYIILTDILNLYK